MLCGLGQHGLAFLFDGHAFIARLDAGFQRHAVGGSAGGHLASSAITLFDHPAGRTGHALDAVSGRPDFAILQYPVIFMEGPHVHAGSRRSLLGTTPAPELVALMSTDRQVTAATPPTFLVHTAEDASVPLENSVAFHAALGAGDTDAALAMLSPEVVILEEGGGRSGRVTNTPVTIFLLMPPSRRRPRAK